MNLADIRPELMKILTSKVFMIVFPVLLAVSLSIAYVASDPRQTDEFLSISTYGSSDMAEFYYPEDDPTISLGESVNWNVHAYNRMGDSEYLSLRVKILNSTQASPDDALHLPSPEDHVLELKQMVMNNSTWVIPINWVITDIEKMQAVVEVNETQDIISILTDERTGQIVAINKTQDIVAVNKTQDIVAVKKLNINGVYLDELNVRGVNGTDFRMILELWRYDREARDFVFTWTSGREVRSAWNQIWFNVV